MTNYSDKNSGLLFFLFGFMGSGKSYIIKNIKHGIPIERLDLDDLIEVKHGKTISDIFEHMGEVGFRRIERDTLKAISATGHSKIIALGGGTPCSPQNIEWIKAHGISIYIKKSVDTLVNNLRRGKSKRPLIANLNDSELESFVKNKLEERECYYQQADYIILEKHSRELVNAIDAIIAYETGKRKHG